MFHVSLIHRQHADLGAEHDALVIVLEVLRSCHADADADAGAGAGAGAGGSVNGGGGSHQHVGCPSPFGVSATFSTPLQTDIHAAPAAW